MRERKSRGSTKSQILFSHLLDEAKEIAERLEEVEFNRVQRQANKAAHNIAKHARHVNEFLVWIEDVLPHLFSIIEVDSTYHQ